MNKITTAIFLLFCFIFTASAKLSVQLDEATVPLGQTFRLTLLDNNPSTRARPDLTPLQKDFAIVGTQQMANYTVINGQANALQQWVILLTPKRTGILTIPPITIGQEKTVASQIEVVNSSDVTGPQQQNGKVPAVKFVTKVSSLKLYVNQQVNYTVKLYVSRRLLDADYQPPQVKDALMVALGEPRQYQVIKKGMPYTVQELQYAFFPQKSGILKITPPQFHALVFDAIPGNVQITAKEIALNVQPAPILAKKTSWLPAKQVTLQETYDNQATNIAAGTMIVRTVTFSATGVAAQLLPKLVFETNNQFSVYPENPTEETHYQQPDLKGIVVIKVTYLFNKSGSIVIPELKLPWFNTTNGKAELASLPARTIMVSPSAAAKVSSNSPAPTLSTQDKSLSTLTTASTGKDAISTNLLGSKAAVQDRLAWFVAIGFGVAWLVTLLLWWWMHKREPGLRKACKKVRIACRRHDPAAVKDALIEWAKNIWPDNVIVNLGDVANLVGALDLQKAINDLSQHLYQDQQTYDKQQVWQGNELARSFAAYKFIKTKQVKRKKNPLPPINP